MPSPAPPIPVAAQVVDVAGLMTVTFDQPLQLGPTAAGNWLATWGPDIIREDYTQPLPGLVTGNTVIVTMANPVLSGGPNVCSYLATPPDVRSAAGIPAAPFTGFPLTVI